MEVLLVACDVPQLEAGLSDRRVVLVIRMTVKI
jgi:hypothetical protein